MYLGLKHETQKKFEISNTWTRNQTTYKNVYVWVLFPSGIWRRVVWYKCINHATETLSTLAMKTEWMIAWNLGKSLSE